MTSITRLSLRFPRLTLAFLVLLSGLAVAGLPQLTTDVGYRAFLGPDHRAVRELDAFLARFGGGLTMAAVWSCDQTTRCESVFDPESLAMAHEISSALAATPGIRRVVSPATLPVAVPGFLGPRLRRFSEDGVPVADREEREWLARRALLDPSWVRRVVSSNGRVAAILLELDSSESEVAERAYHALSSELSVWESRGVRFHRVGGPVEFVVAGAELEAATLQLIPVMIALVGLTLLVLLQSPAAAAAVLVSVGVAVLWSMGLLGWLSRLDWSQNSLTQILPPLVLVIGVCDGIHLVTRYASKSATNPPSPCSGSSSGPSSKQIAKARNALLEETSAEIGAPCLMTSLTTAAGFLSFSGVELASFVRFGMLAAWGVMAALLLSFSLLPLLLRYAAPPRERAQQASRRWGMYFSALLNWSERHHAALLGGAAILTLVCGAGMTQLRVDASFEELYGESSSVVRWARFVGENLRRPDTLEVELRLGENSALEAPSTLQAIGDTSRELAALEALGPAYSLLEPLSWFHRLRRGDDPSFQRPATTSRQNAALLSLYSARSREVGGDGLTHWIDSSGRRVRISIEAEKPPQEVLRRIMGRVHGVLENQLPQGWTAIATGPLAVVHEMIDDIRAAQLESFATAALAVLLLVSVFFRSPVWAALALVPTALPVVVTLGLMGIAGISLDVGSAMVAAVVLGIAVDDCIHLLEQFRRGRRAGAPADVAMREAVAQVGRAIVTTSVALALGFCALALSPWQSVSSFGLVSALAILAALVATLLVLPALVLQFGQRGD